MSFFGQQNNNTQQQGTGFGGFGSNNNQAPGFGQPQNTGFGSGANNTGGSLFGNNNSGFGTGGSGFGANNTTTTPFGGNRPGFGTNTTTTGAMFGSNTATAGASTGFGGFGATNNNSNASGSLFGGANKPAFGTGNASGGSLFGGGSGGNAFGTSNNQPTSVFGAPLSSALGANTAESQGTGSTPFQHYTEKESGTNVANHFQSISFMQPYKNYSFEELRQADYNQGRRFGNASGQPGAFGANTGFGGFGQQPNSNSFGTANASSANGLFGNQPASTASPFGGTQTAASGFGGANSGGGLFGSTAPKPATSIFGGTNATSSQQTGGIFGTAGQTGFGTGQTAGTGFGGGNNNNTGLFAAGNQQQAPKTGFSFSGTNSGNAFGTGGTNANSGASVFGPANTNSAFGGNQQQQQAPAANPFGGFGTNQTQAQAGNTSAFGGFGTGNQQAQKPGGLFGPTNDSNAAGGSIFGGNNQQNNQQQPAASSLFGNPPNNPSGASSLFNTKPASTGTSLFGATASNTANNSGAGLFGGNAFNNNNQNQQALGGGLFGNNNQQQQQQQQQPKPGSLFGGTGATTGGSLFNNNNQQPAGTSMFGNLGSNSQPQSTSLFGTANNAGSSSIFNITQQPNVLQPPQTQIATLGEPPYGNPSIFYGLPPTQHMYAGPVATPIKSTNKTKKNAVLPQYKINPNQASRLVTPQKRGFGFTYSSYGTPSGASSIQSTPGGLGGSLLYNSIGRSLGKSLSTSNLRRSFDREADSLLTPGAFSAGSSRFSNSGSMKKLTIDRNLRTDLFGTQPVAASQTPEKSDQSQQPGILKKVSFDANALGGNASGQNTSENGDTNGFVVQNGSREPSAQEQGYLRSSTRGHSRTNGTILESEMEQVKNNELAIVHEDGSPEAMDNSTTQPSVPISQDDPAPGAYYMQPSREELARMSPEELRHVSGLTVGRQNCGSVTFNEPVDLTHDPLDDVYVKIVCIELRSLTVYPESGRKPPPGKGLNVPSTIYLKNSWPRQRDRKTPSHEKSGPKFNKHVDRLRKVEGTEFVRYETDTGTWVFNVPHFTTYGFEYDDAGSEGNSLQTSIQSEAPDTPTPKSGALRDRDTPRPDVTQSSILSDEQSLIGISPDDPFEIRKRGILPGAYDDAAPLQDDAELDENSSSDESFLGDRLASSPSDSGTDEPSELQDLGDKNGDHSLVLMEEDMELAGSYPQGDLDDADLVFPEPRSVGYGTPPNPKFNPSGDWAKELQRTISPRKQDRQALRENQSNVFEDQGVNREDTPKAIAKSNGAGNTLATSIDLMNSLFGQEQTRKSVRGVQQAANGQGKGFEWPYSKKSKNHNGDEGNMSHADQQFHQSYKPHWFSRTVLIYSTPTISNPKAWFISQRNSLLRSEIQVLSPIVPRTLIKQRSHTRIFNDQGVPFAEVQPIPFKEMAAIVDRKSFEPYWELAAILFDEITPERSTGDSSVNNEESNNRLRKDDLIRLWRKISLKLFDNTWSKTSNSEERAIVQLSVNNVVEACHELVQGKNYRLAILVSQIGGDRIMREDMTTQINEWRNLNVLSEMTEPIRALYELLAGNVCVCEGKKGPLEDRAKTFVISERFKLYWTRAFGLRLWYAILAEEPIEAAIKKYADDVASDKEKKPPPFWIANGKSCGPWKDPRIDQREDCLWGLLKIYAGSRNVMPIPSITSVVTPHNTTVTPIQTLLPFQFYHALAWRFPSAADPEKADELALDVSASLHTAREWIWAIFILLHIHSREQRQTSIRNILAVNAGTIGGLDDPQFKTLTDEFKIPESWIWEAKALYARSVTQNHISETLFLLAASDWDEAHKVLCRVVAPRAVIERDYVELKSLLGAFRTGRERVSDWGLGGGIYEDFVALVLNSTAQDSAENPEQSKPAVLKRLLSGLPAMVQQRVGKADLEEVVAVRDMSDVVAKAVTVLSGEKGFEPWRVLQLPLAKEAYHAHTLRLGLGYYEAVMAGVQ